MAKENHLEWFPMRVTYNRELKVKTCLDCMEIENFIPMHYEITGTASNRERRLVPAIHNLIFVRSDRERLTTLKHTVSDLEPMRFIVTPKKSDGGSEILRVPDRQMENFMRVASVQDDRVMFLKPSDYLNKVGRRVMITGGFFAGVEGVVKRIKSNRHVVVQMEGVAAVAIAYVPANQIAPINE